MPKLINQGSFSSPIVNAKGVPTQAFYQLIRALVSLEMLDGTGSPEGAIKGGQKSLYLDTAANKVYVKTTDYGDNTGWVILN
tara:strand:- start:1257 stop:1502 length:246 start_codon:yes stop_codon:yes gene_type:complete